MDVRTLPKRKIQRRWPVVCQLCRQRCRNLHRLSCGVCHRSSQDNCHNRVHVNHSMCRYVWVRLIGRCSPCNALPHKLNYRGGKDGKAFRKIG